MTNTNYIIQPTAFNKASWNGLYFRKKLVHLLKNNFIFSLEYVHCSIKQSFIPVKQFFPLYIQILKFVNNPALYFFDLNSSKSCPQPFFFQQTRETWQQEERSAFQGDRHATSSCTQAASVALSGFFLLQLLSLDLF